MTIVGNTYIFSGQIDKRFTKLKADIRDLREDVKGDIKDIREDIKSLVARQGELERHGMAVAEQIYRDCVKNK